MMRQVLVVVGPTATGKSEAGIAVAQRFGGEVVNADSMQLYRGMNIGTAKLMAAEQQGVPHHLLDVWDVTQPASVAEYQRIAREVFDKLHANGRVPVLVGGSGLYIRRALDDFDFPGTDAEVRAGLEMDLQRDGTDALHRRLVDVDPEAAAEILPSNGRRLVRALEVVALTGRKFSTRPGMKAYQALYEVQLVGIDPELGQLDERIAQRVDDMLARGLVAEVRALERVGLRRGRTAKQALGYQQILAMLAGTLAESDVRNEIVHATRRFARRQLSWFRRDPRVTWVPKPGDVVAAFHE